MAHKVRARKQSKDNKIWRIKEQNGGDNFTPEFLMYFLCSESVDTFYRDMVIGRKFAPLHGGHTNMIKDRWCMPRGRTRVSFFFARFYSLSFFSDFLLDSECWLA